MAITKDVNNTGVQNYQRVVRVLSVDGLDGAMMVVDRELDRNPDSWEAWGAKADIFYIKKNMDMALDCCDRSIQLNPENALTWNTKGNIFYHMKRYDEAIDCYNRAIDIDPLMAKAWYNKKLALGLQLKKSQPHIVAPTRRREIRRRPNRDGKDGDGGDGSLRLSIGRIK